MPANVQSLGYVGATPWHGLGTRIRDLGLATSAEMVEASGLDWQVGVMETETFFWEPDPSGLTEVDPTTGNLRPVMVKHYLPNSSKSLVRLDNLAILDEGVRRFTPYQNAEMFGWVDAIVGGGHAVYHTAGALGAGETVWVLVEIPGAYYVGPKQDEHKKYILIANYHKAGRAMKVVQTGVRVVCQNTLALAIGGAALADIVSISHMPNIAKRAEAAKTKFGLFNKRYNEIEALFNQLVNVQMTSASLDEGIAVAWPMPPETAESKGSEARRVQIARVREATADLFENGVGQDLYPGSAYNFINAVTEATTHFNGKRTAEAQFQNALLDTGVQVQERALQFARQLLGG